MNWPLRRVPLQRRVPLGALVFVCISYSALTTYNMFVGFPPALWLARGTDSLLRADLAHTLLLQLLLVAGFLIAICRLRPQELGLDVRQFPLALAFTAGAWVVGQVAQLAIHWLGGHEVALNPIWLGAHWHRGLGEWLYQLFGNAPNEEMIFRGFLMTQLVAQWAAHRPRMRPRRQVVLALLVSQAVFALVHVPFDVVSGRMWLLPVQFVFGLVFAVIYLRTGNLFLVMGVHCLFNNPAPLLKTLFVGDHFIGPGILLIVVFVFRSVCFRNAVTTSIDLLEPQAPL